MTVTPQGVQNPAYRPTPPPSLPVVAVMSYDMAATPAYGWSWMCDSCRGSPGSR